MSREKNLARFLSGNHPEVPHVVYHGTDRYITGFDPEKATSEGKAFFFARDSWTKPGHGGARSAGTYAPRRGGSIYPVHLSLKNPYIVGFTKPLPSEDASESEWDKHFKEHKRFDDQFNDDNFKRRYFERAIAHAQDNGHDGVIFKNITDDKMHSDLWSHPSDIFAVFHPTQIKSAIGNNGDYDQNEWDINKAEGGEVDRPNIPQIDNPISVFPKPQRMFPEDARPAGGQYLNARTKEDMTGHKAAMASIGINLGGRPYFNASSDSVEQTGSPGRGSAIAKTNLFKQKAGWNWLQAPEGHEDTNMIVSVEHRGDHHYALNAHFPKGVDLARYAEAKSEPRLRPTTRGNLTKGTQVGSISVRGKEHPVYDHVIVKADGGIVGNPDTDEGIIAYHGSPHDFERFDMSKIGTGEGNQAYGHGLYFAEHEPIAKSYRDALTQGAQNMLIDGSKFHEFHNSTDPEKNLKAKIAINMLHGKDVHDAIDWQIQQTMGKLSSRRLLPEDEPVLLEDLQRLRAMKKQPPVIEKNPGHMYEVHINAHPDHFLDWDKPLREQHEFVRRLAGWSPEQEKNYFDWMKNDTDSLMAELEGRGTYKSIKEPSRPKGSLPMSMSGADIYEHIKNKFGATDWPVDADSQARAKYRNEAAHRASQHLLAHGIKGIRYLDAVSRGASDNPTSNYVVFDDKLVNVKRKYAKGGAVNEYPLDEDDTEHRTSGGHLTWMSPDSFLNKAEKMRGDSDDKKAIKYFEKHIEKGGDMNALALYPSGGQDGRHRATAAKHEGIKKVPVVQWDKRARGGSIVNRALMITSKKA